MKRIWTKGNWYKNKGAASKVGLTREEQISWIDSPVLRVEYTVDNDFSDTMREYCQRRFSYHRLGKEWVELG